MLNHPRIFCLACLAATWCMAMLGVWLRKRFRIPDEEDRANLGIVLSATLTLLGLIIGFTFSMAATRYDLRKLYEEQEANAIGTEYVRADLLPAADAASVKHLLTQYLACRINFYQTEDWGRLTAIARQRANLQDQLWQLVRPQAAAQPNPVTALVVSGMNDVLNSQGYTQFAWWNRIPQTVWVLLVTIALFANLLTGYATQRSRSGRLLLLVLPVIISISFFLVSDIDSPRGGIIRVKPLDLLSLAQSLPSPQTPK